MSRKPLTDATIRAAKPKARRYRISDGHGLALEVSPAGGKHWRYRYELGGKEYMYALGGWCRSRMARQPSKPGRGARPVALPSPRRVLNASAPATWLSSAGTRLPPRKLGQQARAHSSANTFEAVTRRLSRSVAATGATSTERV